MVEGVQLEDFGGDTPSVHVSGLTGQGLPDLVETLSAVAEMQDLRAERGGPAFGHILESNFHKGLGYANIHIPQVCANYTILTQAGCNCLGSERLFEGRITYYQRSVTRKSSPYDRLNWQGRPNCNSWHGGDRQWVENIA